MHSYSTHTPRVKVYAIFAVLSVILAWTVVAILSLFSWPQWLISAPSVVGVYAAIYALFDRRLWKSKLAQSLGLVEVRDISGTYQGSLISTWEATPGVKTTRDVTFTIVQTWTQINIFMSVSGGASTSNSQSAVASVSHNGLGTELVYVYHNEVSPGVADADMGDHEGAADLVIMQSGAMTGRYFNSRPRAGTIEAQRRPS